MKTACAVVASLTILLNTAPAWGQGVPTIAKNIQYIRLEAGRHLIVCKVPGGTRLTYEHTRYAGKAALRVVPDDAFSCEYVGAGRET